MKAWCTTGHSHRIGDQSRRNEGIARPLDRAERRIGSSGGLARSQLVYHGICHRADEVGSNIDAVKLAQMFLAPAQAGF
jgi:hypothetical protein